LEDIDSEIREREHRFSLVLINLPDEKRYLERRLLDLKRERRRETLLSWRDLVWLRSEIAALGRTAKSAENRDVPRRLARSLKNPNLYA